MPISKTKCSLLIFKITQISEADIFPLNLQLRSFYSKKLRLGGDEPSSREHTIIMCAIHFISHDRHMTYITDWLHVVRQDGDSQVVPLARNNDAAYSQGIGISI